MITTKTPRQNLQLVLWRTSLLFSITFILSFSFPYNVLPDPGHWIQHFFESFARFSGRHVFQLPASTTYQLISDSTGFYINAFNILVLSFIIACIWTFLIKTQNKPDPFIYLASSFTRYYLSLQLFIYASSKLFKAQFYQPEPNTLFTRLGEIPKDLLYWSSIGVSRPYSIFLGAAELAAAALLLFRQTRIAGSILAIFIMVNVIAINFAYDISVKLHSCFLLFLALLQLAPDLNRTFRFLTGQRIVPFQPIDPFPAPALKRFVWPGRIIIIILILSEAFLPYLRSGNYNDDIAKRPFLHGAYRVEAFTMNNDTLPPLMTDSLRWNHVFVHRQHYLVIQKMDENMFDHELILDTINRKIQLLNYDESLEADLSYQIPNDSTLNLSGNWKEFSIEVQLKKINLNNLPLLKKEFGWTIDP
jgi:hypothetical protein